MNPGYQHAPLEHLTGPQDSAGSLREFEDWMEVVKQYSPATTKGYLKRLRAVFRQVPSFDYDHILAYLKEFNGKSSTGHYTNTLAALKIYSRFIGRPDLLSDFAFPRHQVVPKRFWNKQQMQSFYDALTSPKMKALFLMGATTGLRRGEVLGLRFEDVDFQSRTVVPKIHTGTTKHSWLSLYNMECEAALNRHIAAMRPAIRARGKLFPMCSRDYKEEWSKAKEISQVPLKFKDLRDFFAQSMLDLGVQSIYIDALSGRAPGSVLAKHYIDLSPQKLRQVYDQAGLKVLS